MPVDITLDNVEEAVTRQNPEKDLRIGDITAKVATSQRGKRGTWY